MVFIDLNKAFDSVHREGLRNILKKIDCTSKFVNTIRSFHDGILGCVLDNSAISASFKVTLFLYDASGSL